MSARDDYPDLGTLRDAYIDGTPQFGGFEAGRALAEIDWLRQDALDEIDRLRAERDTLTAENAELRAEILKAVALHEADYGEGALHAMCGLSDLALVNDNWGLAPREEGKQ